VFFFLEYTSIAVITFKLPIVQKVDLIRKLFTPLCRILTEEVLHLGDGLQF